MEDFDSGWDEPLSSLDSEIMNNFDVGDATMNGYDKSELHEQVLQMRNDPAMSFHATFPVDNSTTENKNVNGSTDCASLSSEIFLATRLLHDETLESTTLSTLEEPTTSSYNDNQNFNNYLGSPLRNDTQHDDSIGLPQRDTLDSEFLYSSFEQLSSERPDLTYDEEGSNKSWSETLRPSELMPAPERTISRKFIGEMKSKGERKKRIIKKVRRKIIKIENSINKVQDKLISHSVSGESEVNLKTDLETGSESHIKLDSGLIENIISTPLVVPPLIIQKQNIISDFDEDYVLPSTSRSTNLYDKNGRKVPSYLKMYRLRDDKYPDIFACKNCYGIFTTLDSALFHQCLKKRRGRRPKILADCLVP